MGVRISLVLLFVAGAWIWGLYVDRPVMKSVAVESIKPDMVLIQFRKDLIELEKRTLYIIQYHTECTVLEAHSLYVDTLRLKREYDFREVSASDKVFERQLRDIEETFAKLFLEEGYRDMKLYGSIPCGFGDEEGVKQWLTVLNQYPELVKNYNFDRGIVNVALARARATDAKAVTVK